jgi:4'-phosphopantetheinyl transferase
MIRLKGAEPFEVWRVNLRQEGPPLGVLSSTERERAARFVFAKDRQRFEVAHGALRTCLGQRIGASPASLRFACAAFGKPALEPIPGLPECAFNLSHSGDVALIAMGNGAALGVDIECWRAMPDAVDLAMHHFAAGEIAALKEAAQSQRDGLFLRIWTRKEACLKAIGMGLSSPTNSFDVGAHNQGETLVRIPDGATQHRVMVRQLEAGADAIAALAWVLEPLH